MQRPPEPDSGSERRAQSTTSANNKRNNERSEIPPGSELEDSAADEQQAVDRLLRVRLSL